MTSPRQAFFARQVTEVSVADTLRVDSTRYERSLSYISEVLSGDDVDQKAADADEKDEEQEDLLVPESECSPLQPKEVNKLIVGKLLVDEDRVIRPVSPSSYLKYAQLASLSLVFFLILLHILRMGCIAFADIWLALWTDRALPSGGLTAYIANDTFLEPLEVSGYVRGYFSSTSMALVMTIIVIFASELIGLRAAGKLHKTLLNSIMHAPLRFFDNTPIGSIMNKFAGDTYLIDDRLSASFEGLLRVLLFCIATLVFNIAVNPYFVVPAIPIILVYYGLETFFRKSSRELHRLDSLTKSPIVALFMETLAGLRTIRAFRDESRFLHLMLTKIDGNTHAFLWLQAANRWLGVRYDVIGALTVFMSCICSISAALAYHVGAGIVGLAISYSVLFASCLTWLVRWVTETETQMNAVERVLNFCKIQQEQLSSIDSIEVPPSWPTQGRIQYSMVSLRYAENLEPVVREISFTIEAGQKVAICGSKGSGKTSITLGLFRTLDIVEGVILVDNVDISKVPVLVLRSHIGIIPQDPTLFVGTIRFNLDPEEKKSDSELWQALEVAHLKSMVEGMPKGLDTHIDDGAESFKPAERQLFGLARVCLRDLQIIVMDEATTSVDMYMDDIVREAVRTIFKDKTVITIAHRISTITDFDTIIAVDQGKLIEMDTPQNLLNKPDSFIAKLMKDHTNSTSA